MSASLIPLETLEIENRPVRSNRQVCAYTAIVACVAVVAFCASKVDPFFQVQFIAPRTGPTAPRGTIRTAPMEASTIGEILSELNPRGIRKAKEPKVDFMAQESSGAGDPFPRPQPTRRDLLRGAAVSILPLPAYADESALAEPPVEAPPAAAALSEAPASTPAAEAPAAAAADAPSVRTTAQALGLEDKDFPQKDSLVLRTYVDPLFDLTFPKEWFSIRRTIDGDIVRRGGVIFSAGNLRTAEVVTVELFKVKELLLQAEALPYFPDGRIKKWSDLGKDTALAQFVCERRDGEATASSRKQQIQARASRAVPGSVSVQGDVLQLDIATDIQGTTARVGEAGSEVMTPGIRRLQRVRLTLLPGGEEVMGVVAGCLDDLWQQGEDQVLGDVVKSFRIKAKNDALLLPA
jgi:hypothetical protein